MFVKTIGVDEVTQGKCVYRDKRKIGHKTTQITDGEPVGTKKSGQEENHVMEYVMKYVMEYVMEANTEERRDQPTCQLIQKDPAMCAVWQLLATMTSSCRMMVAETRLQPIANRLQLRHEVGIKYATT